MWKKSIRSLMHPVYYGKFSGYGYRIATLSKSYIRTVRVITISSMKSTIFTWLDWR